jgi:hypothetical protein
VADRNSYLDLDLVTRVVAMPNLLARNAAITRGYHALSEGVAGILGRDHANWLTFGQWASAEARISISGESVPAIVRPLLGSGVAAAVADGNGAIFADVAPPFVTFINACAELNHDMDLLRERVLADPAVARSDDLTRAFGAYVDAAVLLRIGDPDPRRRAGRILVANASIGAHEQHVADPFVRAAIPGRWISAIVATAHMGLRVPEGTLALSRDVPPPAYLRGAMFPAQLDPLEDPEALALAARFGQDPSSARQSDAPDWESYDERMGFIFTLLRAHQCDPALFALPDGTPEVELPEV